MAKTRQSKQTNKEKLLLLIPGFQYVLAFVTVSTIYLHF